jgi:glycerol kinase
LAGLAVDVWEDLDQLKRLRKVDRIFKPVMPFRARSEIRREWKRAVQRSLNWARPLEFS